MKKIYYNKLIRDKIPQSIVAWGGKYSVKKLSAKEYEKQLLKKVSEEAGGLLSVKTKADLISELADVEDVIAEIKKFKKITAQQIKKAQAEAMAKKGGFKKRLFLFWSSDTGYRTNERRYKK